MASRGEFVGGLVGFVVVTVVALFIGAWVYDGIVSSPAPRVPSMSATCVAPGDLNVGDLLPSCGP